MAGERPILKTDLEEARFAFTANKLSASVATDGTIDGTGSTANPLSINGVALCAALASCTINDLGDVDLTAFTLSYNEILVVDTVSGDVKSLDVTAALAGGYFTGI